MKQTSMHHIPSSIMREESIQSIQSTQSIQSKSPKHPREPRESADSINQINQINQINEKERKGERKQRQDRKQNLTSAQKKITKKLHDEVVVLYIFLELGCRILLKKPKRNTKTIPFLTIESIMFHNLPLFQLTHHFIEQSRTEKKNDKEEIMARSMRLLTQTLNILEITFESKSFTPPKTTSKKRTPPLILKSIIIGKETYNKRTIDDIGKEIKERIIDPLLALPHDHDDEMRTISLDESNLISLNSLPQNTSLALFIRNLKMFIEVVQREISINMIMSSMYEANKHHFMCGEEMKCQEQSVLDLMNTSLRTTLSSQLNPIHQLHEVKELKQLHRLDHVEDGDRDCVNMIDFEAIEHAEEDEKSKELNMSQMINRNNLWITLNHSNPIVPLNQTQHMIEMSKSPYHSREVMNINTLLQSYPSNESSKRSIPQKVEDVQYAYVLNYVNQPGFFHQLDSFHQQ